MLLTVASHEGLSQKKKDKKKKKEKQKKNYDALEGWWNQLWTSKSICLTWVESKEYQPKRGGSNPWAIGFALQSISLAFALFSI